MEDFKTAKDIFFYLKDIVLNFLNAYGEVILSFLMAFIMSMLRTRKSHGKSDWIESFMCAFLTVGVWSLLVYLKLPEVLAVGAGALVGYKGTAFVNKQIDKWGDKWGG